MGLALLLPTGFAGAEDLPWPWADADARTRAEGRGLDQASNPAYQRARKGTVLSGEPEPDPFRRNWSGTRGQSIPVEFPNRYGAMLRGHLHLPCVGVQAGAERCSWPDPITRKVVHGPLPAVVVLPGFGTTEAVYSPLSQQLAEHGYAVLSIDPQGQGKSDPDPPDPRYCLAEGDWRAPQEADLTERGACAGHDPSSDGEAPLVDDDFQPVLQAARAASPAVSDQVLALAIFASLHYDREEFVEDLPDTYERFRTRFTFAGIDAADWLVSPLNPFHALVDADRVGVVGHSAGADAAIIAGNAHRQRRFRAAVAWDTFGTPPWGNALVPTIPTMIHNSEQAQFTFPWGIHPPNPEMLPAHRTFETFERAGVPAYLFALRGSTHNEWAWFPDALIFPPFGNASSKGMQVSVHLTLAWFDRWLKGHGSRVHAAHARTRLTAERFDDTADRSSIGQGTYDPIADANVPYRIAGDAVSEHTSRMFNSKYAFDGLECRVLLACLPSGGGTILATEPAETG